MRVSVIGIIVIFFVTAACNEQAKEGMMLKHVEFLFKQQRYNEGKLSIDSFLTIHPVNEQAWILKGDLEEKLDNDTLAYEAYEKALEINPNLEQALTGLGVIWRKRGDYGLAANYYSKAISVNPEYAQAYSSLAGVELQRRNYENAVTLGEKGFQLDSKDPIIAANLSIAYHYYGNTSMRDNYYDIARQLNYPNLKILDMIFKGKASILAR